MENPSVILAFESANFSASVAIMQHDQLLAEEIPKASLHQSQPLIKIISQVLEKANLSVSQVQGVITTTGPGSFTGVRNAMAIAKAFSVALNGPVIGLNSFEWVFRTLKQKGPLGIILDSRRLEPFCALFDEKGFLKKPFAYLAEADISLFMEGHTVYDTRLQGLPTAVDLAKVALADGLFRRPDDFPLSPLYLRSAEIG